MLPTFRTFALLLLCGAAPAWASDNTDEAEAADGAPEIVVTGERAEYGVKATATATRTNTPLRNIPQAISVVSEAQIHDQDLRSVADLLTFVPGAMPGTGESNRDQMTLRGNSSTADFFIDGIRDDVQYFRDLYNLDRVEVLKGPNAMIFGRGGGGGVVNRVTKRASLGTDRDVSIAGDGEGGYRLTADLDQALSGSAGFRVNGMYEDGESFRRHVDLKRHAINPTVGFVVGGQTRIDVGYEYLRDRRTADRGVPAARQGSLLSPADPLEGYDRTFFGDPDASRSSARVHLGTFAISHDFGSGLTVRNRTLYGNYDKTYQNVYPNGPVTSVGTVRLSAYRDSTTRKNLFSQTDLIWESGLGGVDQTLLLGFELGRQTGNNQRRIGAFGASASAPTSINVPVDAATIAVPNLTLRAPSADNDSTADVAAIYVQNQIRPANWLELVAGLRFDRFSMDIDNLVTSSTFARTDHLWSPRLGLVVKPRENVSFYASYSRSYLPQSGDQFNSLAANTQTLKPERFDNYEIGGKWELGHGLLATAAVYKLDRTNTRATDPSNPLLFVLTGAQRSRGLEIGLERSVSARWQISAGYALQKAEISETTAAAPEGREVPLVPRHQFSLWNRYDISKQVGVGLGLIARSAAFASISNEVRLPGYARADAAAYYRLTPQIQAQVNVENLLGADYFSTAHNDNNIAPGPPRTIRATFRFGI